MGTTPGHTQATTSVGGGFGVVDDGVRADEHAVSGQVGPPAEVEIVSEQLEMGIETGELVPHVASYQHAGTADGKNLADDVVLALIELTSFQPGLPASPAGDRETDLEQLSRRRPTADLGSD